MSDSVQPHKRQPTRLLCPWDSPGKNPGVGCHFLLQCMKAKSESEVTQSCLTLRPHGLYSPWNYPGQNTGVGSFPFSRGFSQPGIEPRSPAWQADSLPAEPQGSLRILEWVAYPLSSRSSQPRNRTGVSCIVGGDQLSYQGSLDY